MGVIGWHRTATAARARPKMAFTRTHPRDEGVELRRRARGDAAVDVVQQVHAEEEDERGLHRPPALALPEPRVARAPGQPQLEARARREEAAAGHLCAWGASEGLAWVVDGLAFVRLQPAARLPVWPGWLGRDEMVSEVAARHAQAHRSSSEVRVTSRGVVAV